MNKSADLKGGHWKVTGRAEARLQGRSPGPTSMKRDAEYFDGVEPELIFVARRLGDAISLESVLTAAGVDYAVEADHYEGGVIFKSMRVGAFFYVRPESRERAVAVMLENGYVPPTA
jgi:hypothetical protein